MHPFNKRCARTMAEAVVIFFLAGLVMCWFSSMHVAVGRANPDSERDPLCSCEYYSSETGDKSHLLDFIDDQAVGRLPIDLSYTHARTLAFKRQPIIAFIAWQHAHTKPRLPPLARLRPGRPYSSSISSECRGSAARAKSLKQRSTRWWCRCFWRWAR